LPVTQGNSVSHEHVVSIIEGNHDRVSSQVKVKNIDSRREKVKFLPDTGANITAFQPEILPQLGMSINNLRMVSTKPKSADGSNLKTLGAVDVQLS
jgi:hypothetical protein